MFIKRKANLFKKKGILFKKKMNNTSSYRSMNTPIYRSMNSNPTVITIPYQSFSDSNSLKNLFLFFFTISIVLIRFLNKKIKYYLIKLLFDEDIHEMVEKTKELELRNLSLLSTLTILQNEPEIKEVKDESFFSNYKNIALVSGGFTLIFLLVLASNGDLLGVSSSMIKLTNSLRELISNQSNNEINTIFEILKALQKQNDNISNLGEILHAEIKKIMVMILNNQSKGKPSDYGLKPADRSDKSVEYVNWSSDEDFK
jgi:hypothetical protein